MRLLSFLLKQQHLCLLAAACLVTPGCHAFSVTSPTTATAAAAAAAASRRALLKPSVSSHPLLASPQNDQEQVTSSFDPLTLSSSSSDISKSNQRGPSFPTATTAVTSLTSMFIWMATSQMAVAAEPDWGIFEGRTGSLLHPIMMGGLFLYSAYTAFLGFQYRRQRTIGDEISALKKTIPAAAAAATDAEGNELPPSPAVVQAQDQIAALTAERKDLSQKAPRDQHFAQGALLAFLGTAFAIVGPLNTFARAGKLFPGPHLYAGAGLVVLWALAVSTIPSMQKGNDTARTIHIAANLTGMALFAWQVTTGIPILLKVIEKTSWP